MNRIRKIIAGGLVLATFFSLCACSKGSSGSGRSYSRDESKPELRGSEQTVPTSPTDPGVTLTPPPGQDDGIVDMTMFIALPGNEKAYDNDIKGIIAEKTGVRVEESWLYGITPDEAVGILMASGELPDYIYAGSDLTELYQNGYLVAWDKYLDLFPNLKELYTDEQWERFRMDDGHIYWADVFGSFNERDTNTKHIGQAFWIQVRVLEWAGYPEIQTLDQYFDLIERYADANPELPDGTPVIPYTCISEDWRYYSLESAPMYLDGYPNDGCVIVNVDAGADNPEIIDYNTTDTAREYFRKLNEEYQKGYIDHDFAVQTYDQYISKITTGAVLGMSDQYWDFGYNVEDAFSTYRTASDGTSYRLKDIGCDYVPLGLTAEEGMQQQYHTYGADVAFSSGIAVTTSCLDPDTAFRFMNDLLGQEIHDLRFWGIEGFDYLTDDQGLYYRTEEMRENWRSNGYMYSHTCEYSYMPQLKGMSRDGINRMMPGEQPEEFKSNLSKPLRDCFDAYGADNYVDFLGSVYCDRMPWYPLYTWSNNLTSYTPGGQAWQWIGECKHEWLPKLVLSDDFDSAWDEYMLAYEGCDPGAFIDEARLEVNARIAAAREYGWTI